MARESLDVSGANHTSVTPLLIRSDSGMLNRELSERLLTTEVVSGFMDGVVAQTAAFAWVIKQAGPFPRESETNYKRRLDEWPTKLMEGLLDRSLFGVNIVGCEGDKERRNGGAENAVYTIRGHHGGRVDRRLGSVDSVIDPVELTKELFAGRVGSTSTSASDLEGNVPLIPPDFLDEEKTIKSDASYLNRVALGPDFIGAEPGMSWEEIIEIGRRRSGIIDLRQMVAVVLRRPRNDKLIRKLQEIGVSLFLIEGGDLIPGLAALKGADMSAKPEERVVYMSLGSGGKEEGLTVGMGARADPTKRIFWGRYEDDKGNPSEQYPGVRTLDTFVPGNPRKITVNIAGITGIDPIWFNDVPAISSRLNGRLELTVSGFSITAKDGFKPRKRICTVSRDFLDALARGQFPQIS